MGQLIKQLLIAALLISSNWTAQIELEPESQPDKLAYCRALQRLQQEYELSDCAQILEDEFTMTGELLMDTQQRCWWGYELFGKRCRKRA
ncbi:hypothetical protein ACLKA7_003704 [Drosophila subpalustris]